VGKKEKVMAHTNATQRNALAGILKNILTIIGAASVYCGSLAIAETAGSAPASASASNWKQVEEAMGRPGQMQPGDVIRFGMPRKDLHVTLDGVDIKPGLAFGSWVAFKQESGGAMVMGDLVLTEDEVEPVMMKLQEAGIHESALHNHLLGESPHVMYMHIASHGNSVAMAKAIHDAVALTKTPGPDAAPAAQSGVELGFDQKQVEQILGRAGKINGGILQFGVPRAELARPSSGLSRGPRLSSASSRSGKTSCCGGFSQLSRSRRHGPPVKSSGSSWQPGLSAS
jgi:hypothetical protein